MNNFKNKIKVKVAKVEDIIIDEVEDIVNKVEDFVDKVEDAILDVTEDIKEAILDVTPIIVENIIEPILHPAENEPEQKMIIMNNPLITMYKQSPPDKKRYSTVETIIEDEAERKLKIQLNDLINRSRKKPFKK